MNFLQRIPLVLIILCLSNRYTIGQIVINEGSNKNGNTIADEDGDFESWIELYNAGVADINIGDYSISDDSSLLNKWTLPNYNLGTGQFLLLFTSGKDRKPDTDINHWEQPIDASSVWKYIVPNAFIPATWINPGYDDATWSSGLSSVGYGDDDDNSVVPDATRSVYLRQSFTITDTSKLGDALFSIDYDDGFVAYINGNVIALNGFDAGSPLFNDFSAIDHEAAMYGGGNPEHFSIDEALIKSYLVEGENILAIEVHNVTEGSSDLTALPFLSFAVKDELIIWTDVLPAWFPTTTLTANLHTNFKISAEGEKIYLSDADGISLDTLFVNVEFADHSVGCVTDGATATGIFMFATPGASNTGATYDGYTTGEATFTLDAGFYTGTQITSINVPAGTEVHYTLNGEIPTLADPLYTSPITIDETQVIKARVFDLAGELLPGQISTNTFFIDESISVPVISISTNNDNLYGGFGIFDNWWNDWKKYAHVEYFDSLHYNAFEQAVGIKVDGGAGGSRSLEQKSMRVELDNSAFGDGELHYPLLKRRSWVEEYETFYLRNGSNMSNVLPYKDAFMVRTTEGTYNEHMAYEPVVIFINGEYWGLYELRNKLDEGHFENAKGVEGDSLDLLTLSYWYGLVLRTLSGSDTDFIAMRTYLGTYPTPEDPEFYFIADSLLDLKNFTDYIAAQMFFANYDWPYNNIKAWRDRGGDNKWKYALIDVELGLGIGGWSDANADLIPGLFIPQEHIEPLYNLLKNPIYHDYFVNRYADLMNSTFLPERTLAMEDSIYNEVLPEMPRQLERWGYGTVDEQMATFENYREALRDDFDVRANKERTHIKNGFGLNDKVDITLTCSPSGAGYIKISTLTIFDMPWTGTYFDGVPVQITAYPNTGYTFSHWDDSEFIVDVLANGFLSNMDDDVTFTANFTGAPQPSLIAINEINYNPEATVNAGNWIELWNYGTADVNISEWKVRDADFLHEFIFPDNTWIPADGRLVLAVDTTLFFGQNPDVTNVMGPLGFGLNNATETIKLINLKNEVVQEIQYTDDAPWPGGADGQGRTMERSNPFVAENTPSNWFDGCIGGSPGLPYTPCEDAVIFSEINYHAGPDFAADDWIELRNVSTNTLDLSGWKFMDDSIGIAHEYIIGDGTSIDPAQHLVLAKNTDAFTETFPDVSNVIGPFNFELGDNGEWIRMYNADGILSLSVNYRDLSPWPLAADGGNYTLELIDSLGLMNSGLNWETICPGGSPGTYASTPCEQEIPINEFELGDFIQIYPNPTENGMFVQMPINELQQLTIELIALDGSKTVMFNQTVSPGNFVHYIDIQNFANGVYLLAFQFGNQTRVGTIVKQ